MKRIKILLCIVSCMFFISGSAQRTFQEVSSIKGVTTVYVGSPVLKLGAKTMADETGRPGVYIAKMIKDLTSIEMIKCKTRSAAQAVRKVCDTVLSKYPFELITQVQDDSETITISGVMEKNGKFLTMLFIEVGNNVSPLYILMKGKIDIETLNNVILTDLNE